MHKKNRPNRTRFLQKGSTAYEILVSLKDAVGDVAYFTLIHPPHSISGGLYEFDRRMEARTRAKGVSQLKRQGILREYKKGSKRYLTLTRKAKLEITRYTLSQKKQLPWDNKWRIVIFDIPEATRKDRDFLRKQLQWLGFLELQKSVWIFPHDIKNELQEFISLCNIELNGDIRFLTVEHIDKDHDLRAHFSLK